MPGSDLFRKRSYVPKSMSTSVPSSRTNTSPWRNGFMVPQSTLR